MDDLLICGDDIEAVEELKQNLSENFKMKHLGKAKHYLGMNVLHSKKTITLSQREYLEKVLRSKVATTPIGRNRHI